MDIFDRIKHINPSTIYELGACDGNETARFCQMFPFAKIVALEPVPKLADIIRGRRELRGVRFYQRAIGNKIGTTPLYVSSGISPVSRQDYYASSSIKEPLNAEKVFEGMKFSESECQVITLDALWKREGMGVIDFIYADIQGAEKEMIEGGSEALANTRFLYTECEGGDYYSGTITKEQLFEMLPNWEVVEDYGNDILLRNKWR